MKANQLHINNFLQAPNVQFVIPVYQRIYDKPDQEIDRMVYELYELTEEEIAIVENSWAWMDLWK